MYTTTLAGFIVFIRTQMGISTMVLPDTDPAIEMAYCVARDIANPAVACVSPLIYSLMVYNLGGSNLIEFAQDQPGAPMVAGSSPPAPYFVYLRTKWNLNDLISGVISASSDEGTSQSLVVQDAAAGFSVADLQYLKTPYGRTYLSYAQRYGANFGLT